MLNLRWLESNRHFIILALVGIVFLFVYSWLFIGTEAKFTSPDETANYHFIKLVAEKNQLRFYEPLNEVTDGLVRPRSMGFVDGFTVPGSFLGIILIYGILAKVFGTGIILYLTPIISVIAVLFFYLLIKEIFDKKIAFISSLLLFILPPFWYYSTRGMFHNILFISLLIIGFYFFVKFLTAISNRKRATSLNILLSGFFIGLALITRTSEVIWVGIILLVLIIVNRSKFGWRNLAVFLGPLILLFILILLINSQIYGSILGNYSQGVIETSSLGAASQTLYSNFQKLVLPFGVDFERVGQAAYQYLIVIFSWFSILLLVGLVWLVKNIILGWFGKIFPEVKDYLSEIQPFQKLYLGLYLLILIWLVIYYGSYEFYEYLDRTKIILGSSYIRYWLPLYVFGLPLVVLSIMKISQIFTKRWLSRGVVFLLVISFCIFSVNKTLTDPLQGLFQVKKYIVENAGKAKIITEQTGSNSVIISGYADKVFFPHRRVIVNLPFNKKKQIQAVEKLLDQVPVYYFYNPLDEAGEQVIDSLKASGYEFKEIYNFAENNEVLYKLQ